MYHKIKKIHCKSYVQLYNYNCTNIHMIIPSLSLIFTSTHPHRKKKNQKIEKRYKLQNFCIFLFLFLSSIYFPPILILFYLIIMDFKLKLLEKNQIEENMYLLHQYSIENEHNLQHNMCC